MLTMILLNFCINILDFELGIQFIEVDTGGDSIQYEMVLSLSTLSFLFL
jgi:hypothetical protein